MKRLVCVFLLVFLLLSACASRNRKTYNFLIKGDFNYVSKSIEKNILYYATSYLDNTDMFYATKYSEDYYQDILVNKKDAVIMYETSSLYTFKMFIDAIVAKALRNAGLNIPSLILLGAPIKEDAVLPLPWSFIGFNARDIAKKLLTVIPQDKNDGIIIILSPFSLDNLDITKKEETKDSNVDVQITKDEQLYFVDDTKKEKMLQFQKQFSMYANESLAHATYLNLKESFTDGRFKELFLGEYSRDASYAVLTNLLKKTEENISTVIAFSDEVAIGALFAFENNNMKIPTITGFGYSPEAQRYIEKGKLRASFKVDYQIYTKTIFDIAERMFFENANVPIGINKGKAQPYKATTITYIPAILK